MKLTVFIVTIMLTLLGTTSLAIAQTESVTFQQEETWFGDAYEEDGCFCE